MISVSLGQRHYGYHLPSGVSPATAVPVVLVLHALGLNSSMMEQATGFSALSDREGFIAVYPDGTEQPNNLIQGLPPKIQQWNSGGVFSIKGVDDVKFIADVLSDLSAKCPIDPKKVYVVGMSNGAMLAYRLADELPNNIAAIATVAGTKTSNKTSGALRTIPLLHIHGTADQIVSYAGAAWHPPVEDVVEAVAQQNQCGIVPVKSAPFPAGDPLPVEKWDYPVGPPKAEVILYRVLGGGHTWPQQANIPGVSQNLGLVSSAINATEVIWDFFKHH